MRGYQPGVRHFFASRQGDGQLARTRVWQIVKEADAAAGIPPEFNVHSLRHSSAVHALDAGLQLEDVRDMLRHRRVASTDIYGTLSPKRRDSYQKRLDESEEIVKVRS